MIHHFFSAYDKYKVSKSQNDLGKVYEALIPLCNYTFRSFINDPTKTISILSHDLATDIVIRIQQNQLNMEEGIITYLRKRSKTIIQKSNALMQYPFDIRIDLNEFEIEDTQIDNELNDMSNVDFLQNLPPKIYETLISFIRFPRSSFHFITVLYEIIKNDPDDSNISKYAQILHKFWKHQLKIHLEIDVLPTHNEFTLISELLNVQ